MSIEPNSKSNLFLIVPEYPGLCFASTNLNFYLPGMSWPLHPFCGVASCVKVRTQEESGRTCDEGSNALQPYFLQSRAFSHGAFSAFQGRDGSLIERVTDCGPEPKLPLPKGCVVTNLRQLQDNSTVLEYPQVRKPQHS